MAKVTTVTEKTKFSPDDETEDRKRNAKLAALLTTTWKALAIVRIERIEIGTEKGWRVTYRE
jgi:hypothetical protein